MHIVFLSDRHDIVRSVNQLNRWIKKLPLDGDDLVTLYYYDQVLENIEDDVFFEKVITSLEKADLIVACGQDAIEQMQDEKRKHFRMPSLSATISNYVYIRCLVHVLGIVIDTIRGKTY